MNQGETKDNSIHNGEYDSFLKEGISVHTMPKGFRRTDVSSDGQHKNMGIFIMIGGLALLSVFGFLAYYLIVEKDFLSLNNKNTTILEEKNPNPVIDEQPKLDSEIKKATTTNLSDTTSDVGKSTSSIDDLISEFNQSLGSSTVGTSSELVNIAENDLSIAKTQENSSSTLDNDNLKKEVVIKDSIDIDADGLSDLEELLLESDPNVMDTDTDGFSDFQELDRMYNPAGKGNLASNKAISSYYNPTHHYSLIYPAAWLYTSSNNDNSVSFNIDSSQFVKIVVQNNPSQQTIYDWYKKQFDVDVIDDLQRVANKKDWTAVVSKDGLNYYLSKDGISDIYVISYNLGISNTLNYQKLFEMMVNSLDVVN